MAGFTTTLIGRPGTPVRCYQSYCTCMLPSLGKPGAEGGPGGGGGPGGASGGAGAVGASGGGEGVSEVIVIKPKCYHLVKSPS